MDKVALLELFASARKRAEQGALDINAQNALILALGQKGLDATKAKALLLKLVATQNIDFARMDQLLDEMDDHDRTSSW